MLDQQGASGPVYGFTGEQEDSATGLLYLRARYYSPSLKTFMSRDSWQGTGLQPQTLNYYTYGLNNPVIYIDPSGHVPEQSGTLSCPVGRWDCEAVRNVYALRQAFLDSAARHNKIPGMDNNGFAALIAATIVSERRIGNVPPPGDRNDRASQRKENFAARFGCIVSGNYLKPTFESEDWSLFLRYLTNQEIPEGHPLQTLASVGIGNVKLYTAANLWKGQACNVFGECTSVQVSTLKTTNALGWTINIANPFGSQVACTSGGRVQPINHRK